jgi:hypothetical protein
LVRIGVRSLSFGIAAIALGFILKFPGTQPDSSDQEMPVVQAGFSVFGQTHPGTQPRKDHLRVASLDPAAGLAEVAAGDMRAEVAVIKKASFEERFASLGEPMATFNDRFGLIKPKATEGLKSPQFDDEETADRSDVAEPDAGKPNAQRPDAPPLPPVASRPARPEKARPQSDMSSYDDGRTAIYDITSHVVYLPNGRRLEAHSGLGKYKDSPDHVHLRMRGATPPNIYKLTMRERLFHGVRALRMTPVGKGKMYGRNGILAHTYMLGPSGQSNGCVSFRNYPEFLNAYLRGEITRIAVVERLDNPPGPQLASGWLPNVIRNLFKPAETTAYANAQ